MNDDQLIIDLYAKYGNKQISKESVEKIKQLYGGNYDQMISDIYQKFKGKPIKPESVSKIKSLYGLQATQTQVEQPVQVNDQPEQRGAFRTVGKFVQSLPGLVSRGATEFIPAMMEVAGAGESLIGSGLRKLGVNESDESLFQKGAETTRQFIEEGTYVDPDIEQSIAGQVAKGVGQVIPFVATSGLSGGAQLGARAPQVLGTGKQLLETGKAIGKQAVSPSGVIGGSMIAGPEWTAAKEAGLSDEDAFNIMVQNYFVGQTEVIPIQNALRVLDRVTGGSLVNLLKSMGTGGFEEAVQETFQTYLTNQIAKGSYDPERDPMFQVLESAKVGGLVGMLIPAVGSVVPRSKQVQEKLDKKVVELQINEEISKSDTGNPDLNEGIDNQTKEVTDAIQKQGAAEVSVQSETTSSEEVLKGDTKEGVQEPTSEEEKVTKEIPESQKEDIIGTEPTATIEELVKEFNESGTLLGQAEGNAADKRSVLAENVADFLRQKNVTDPTQVATFAEQMNALGIEGQPTIKRADVKRIADLLKAPKQQAFDGEKIVATVQKSIEAVTNHFVKGKVKGIREGRKFINDQLQKLTSALKESPLSRRQTAAVIRRVRNTNSFTPGSVSKLNDFITKVVNDATYVAKVRQADNLRAKIKKIKTTSLPERELIRKFKQIDPTETDIDTYLAQAEQVAKTGKKAPQVKEINDYVLSTLRDIYKRDTGKSDGNALDFDELFEGITTAREADRAEARVQRLIEKFGGILSEEEVRMLAQNDSPVDVAIAEDVKKQKALEELQSMAKEAQAMLPDEVPTNPDYGNPAQDKEIYDALRTLNVDDFVDGDGNISGNELKQFLKTLDRVTTNADYSTAGRYAVLAKTNQDFGLFEKLKGGFKVIPDIGLLKGLSQKFASLPTYVQNVFGLADVASKFQLYSGMTGLSDANAKAVNEERDLLDKTDKFKAKHPQLDTDEYRFRRGLYNRLVAYRADADPDATLQENKDLVEQDIATYEAAKETDSARILKNLYKPFKNARTIEDVEKIMQKIDPLGKQLHDMIADHFRGYWKRLSDYNYYYFGTKSPEIINYTGERRWVKVGEEGAGLFSNDIDELTDKFAWTVDPLATKPKQTRSGMARSAKVNRDRSGKIKPKIDKAGNFKVTNYNLDGAALSSIRRTQFDVNAIPAMLQVRMFGKKHKQIIDVMGGSETASNIYQDIFGPNGIYDAFEKASLGHALESRKPDRFDKFASNILANGRRLAYKLVLSGYSQIVKQSTVLINAAIKLGISSKYLNFDAFKQEAKDFLKGRSVSVREEQQSIFNIGDYVDTHTISDQVSAFSITKPSRKRQAIQVWLGGLKALIKTDAKVAEISYLAFYRQYLRKNKLKFGGWKTEKQLEDTAGRREAHAYAKQMVDVLQTTSNPSEQAKGLKDRGVGTQVLKGTLIPYGTFTLNQKMRLIGDTRALFFGNRKQRVAAMTDIAATAAEITAFKTFSYGLRVLYGTGFYMAVKSLLPGLDDEGEEEAKKRVDNFRKDLYTSLLVELAPTILTQPDFMQPAIAQAFNQGYFKLWNMNNPDYQLTQKEFEKEIGMPFMAITRGGGIGIDAVLDNFGMFGAAFDSAKEIIKDISIFADEQLTEIPTKKLTDDQRKLALIVAVLEVGALRGVVPADVKFTARRELKKQLRQRRNDTYPIN